MPQTDSNNYTIGKGKLLLKLSGESAYRDFGNSPDFKINVETTKVEHFSSRGGLKKKDADIVIQQKASLTFQLDEITPDNVMFFSMAKAPTSVLQNSGSEAAQAVVAVHDQWVALGKTKISNVVVNAQGGTPTYTEGDDYDLDTEEGLIYVKSDGAIADGENLEVDYDYAEETRKRVDAATRNFIEGDLLFVGDPPKGRKVTIKGWATINPSGETGLIGDEVIAMNFQGEFLEKSSYNGLYEWHDRGQVA